MDTQVYSLLPLVILVGVVAWVVVLVRKGRRNTPAIESAPVEGAAVTARSGGFGLVFERLCWGVTLLFCAAGAVRLFDLALSKAASAPQYAAEAAGVCAAVLVPYVFSRAIQALRAG